MCWLQNGLPRLFRDAVSDNTYNPFQGCTCLYASYQSAGSILQKVLCACRYKGSVLCSMCYRIQIPVVCFPNEGKDSEIQDCLYQLKERRACHSYKPQNLE